jgi:hypothetical protein
MTTPFGAARQDERPLLCHHLPLPRAPSDLLQLEVVKEAQALHTIPLVRDSGEPQRNRLPTFLIGGTVVLVSICILITSYDVTDIYCTKINDIIKNR